MAWSGASGQYRDFVDRYSLSFPQIDDTAAEVFTRFDIFSQPAFAIVTPTGEVETLLGAPDEQLLDSIIADAVG